MDPTRWQEISFIYRAALERDEESRTAFLDETCGGNDTLRREIESLLGSDADAASLLNAFVEAAARVVAGDRGELRAGQRLAHYRVVGRLGAGGMGVVYRARDEQLRRDIAVKVLAGGSFGDELARARLLREARSAAALNHPSICTIHEVGEADGQLQWPDDPRTTCRDVDALEDGRSAGADMSAPYRHVDRDPRQSL